jgi:ABC-type sugar transport system permease subunit
VVKALKVSHSGFWKALPTLLAIMALVDYPLAFATYFSFRRIVPGQPGGFIGLENYSRMLRAHRHIRRHRGVPSQAG